MMSRRQELAVWGERTAAEFLEERGFQLVERNVRTPYGEIDLIVQKSGQGCEPGSPGLLTVFVEVKTRSSVSYGFPETAITASKRAHILAAAQDYIRTHPQIEGNWRVDVIAILRNERERHPQIVHFENAVTAE